MDKEREMLEEALRVMDRVNRAIDEEKPIDVDTCNLLAEVSCKIDDHLNRNPETN